MKKVSRLVYKTFRNLKVSELVHLCKTSVNCEECPLNKTCFCLCSLLNFDEKILQHRVRIRYSYIWERKSK